MKITPQESFSKISFQEFRHSRGMTESSPAIYRQVYQRKRARPEGTLEQSHETILLLPSSLFSLCSFVANS
jgi:hypothetical protein